MTDGNFSIRFFSITWTVLYNTDIQAKIEKLPSVGIEPGASPSVTHIFLTELIWQVPSEGSLISLLFGAPIDFWT